MPTVTTPIRGLARQGARALRNGATLLERIGAEAPRKPQSSGRKTGPKDLDDVTLARKVENQLFRTERAVKGKVKINVVDHVVYLRGEVKTPAVVKRLQAKAQAIPEVRRVENLLHLPKTPAPTRSDTPSRQRKPAGRRTKPRTASVKKKTSGRVNAEVPATGGEPSPNEVARKRQGRKPAPLGARSR
jgi:hypothetical protein